MTATYADIDDVRGPDGVLEQYTDAAGAAITRDDVMLQACLNDAQSILDGELGITLAAAVVGSREVYGDGTIYLTPPPFTAGSVTAITAPTNYTVPGYIEQSGSLVTVGTGNVIYQPSSPYHAAPSWFWTDTYSGWWSPGVPYTVAATYGAAAADLLVARRICLETATALWKFRDAGGSTAVGTESAVVVVKNTWSPMMREAIARLRQKYNPNVGVW